MYLHSRSTIAAWGSGNGREHDVRRRCARAGGDGELNLAKGALLAGTTLRTDGIQDLAEQIPDLVKAAAGHDLKFQVHVQFGGETPPEPGVVDRINVLLAEVSEDWKLK